MEITLNLRKKDYKGPVVKSFKALVNSPFRLKTANILEPVVAYLADNIDPTSVYYLTLKVPNVSQQVALGYVPTTTRLRFPYTKEQLPKLIAKELEFAVKTLARCEEVSNSLILGWDKPLRPKKSKLHRGLYTLVRKWGKAKFDAIAILEKYEAWQFYLSTWGISNLKYLFKDLDAFSRFTPDSAEVVVYTYKFSDVPKMLRFRELKDFLGGEYASGLVRK